MGQQKRALTLRVGRFDRRLEGRDHRLARIERPRIGGLGGNPWRVLGDIAESADELVLGEQVHLVEGNWILRHVGPRPQIEGQACLMAREPGAKLLPLFGGHAGLVAERHGVRR